ncbi:MAG TPA: hypothetical protein VEB43_07030 [Anaeromyxobacter sp.]|nr:hypothetical protein [Anaeromyxobacter sp.]
MPGAALPALLLALAASAAPDPAAPADAAKRKETPLSIVNGTVRAIDLATHQLVLEVDGAPATLALDRNSLVYLPAGLATVAALRPGDEVRAGRNGRNVAYWIEVRRPAGAAAAPAAKPGQGTGPGGASPPPAEGTGGAPAPGNVGGPR